MFILPSISRIYHIETVNYHSILSKLFLYNYSDNIQVLCKLLFLHNMTHFTRPCNVVDDIIPIQTSIYPHTIRLS